MPFLSIIYIIIVIIDICKSRLTARARSVLYGFVLFLKAPFGVNPLLKTLLLLQKSSKPQNYSFIHRLWTPLVFFFDPYFRDRELKFELSLLGAMT